MNAPQPNWSLCLVTDDALAGARGVPAVVREAVAGGVTVVQIREKTGDSRAFLKHALALRAWLRPRGVPLIVNDRADIALAAGADGVHVGQGDLPCEAVRRLAGPGLLIGVSVGSVDEAVRAESDGADYLSVSPVFATPTKSNAPPPVGLGQVLIFPC